MRIRLSRLVGMLVCFAAMGGVGRAQPPMHSDAALNPQAVGALPPVAVQWNADDRRADAIARYAFLGPASVVQNFLYYAQTMLWEEASLSVSGADVATPAVKQMRSWGPEPNAEAAWTLDPKVTEAEDERIANLKPGEDASVDVKIDICARNVLGVELRATEIVTLRREILSWPRGLAHEAGEARVWRIVPPETTATQKGATRLNVIGMYALLLTDTDWARQFAGARRSVGQAKQLGVGFMQFLQDWDEKFDMNETNWREKLKPYIPDARLFNAPGDAAGTSGYSFNSKLAGKLQSDIRDMSQTVLVYLGKDGKLEGRYDGLATVCYADGHVKMVKPDTPLRWEP